MEIAELNDSLLSFLMQSRVFQGAELVTQESVWNVSLLGFWDVPQVSSRPSLTLTRPSSLHRKVIVEHFVEQIQDAILSQTFRNLTLYGISNQGQNMTDETFRISIQEVDGHLIPAEGKKSPRLQMTVKFHGDPDIRKNMKVTTLQKSLFYTSSRACNIARGR